MFARRGKNEPIDAAAELERREQERIEGERGASELGAQQRQSPPGAKTFLAVLVVAIGALGVAFTIKAMQIFGGSGYMKDYPLEKLLRDAMVLPIISGANEVLKHFMSQRLLEA